MAGDLQHRLSTIIDTCAPSRNNDCLHQQLQGLSMMDMANVAANYVQYVMNTPAAKSLPVLNLDSMMAGIDIDHPHAPGNVFAYNFHERY
jgi:hypothetical protein